MTEAEVLKEQERLKGNLERDLIPFVLPGVKIEVECDAEGALHSVTLEQNGDFFTVYGDAFTWERR